MSGPFRGHFTILSIIHEYRRWCVLENVEMVPNQAWRRVCDRGRIFGGQNLDFIFTNATQVVKIYIRSG